MKMKKYIKLKVIPVVVFVGLLPLTLSAQEEAGDEEKKIWKARAGVKEIVSSGLYSTAAYTKPYAGAEVEWNSLYASAGTAGMIQYSLYDASGNDKKVNLYQLTATAGLVDFYHVSMYLQYGWNGGECSYRQHDVTASLELVFDAFYINGDYSFSKNSYEYNGSLDMDTYAWSAGVGYDFTDSFSTDLGFSNINNRSDIMDIDYSRRSVRAGATVFWDMKLFLMSGLSYGWDTSDYNFYGADISAGFFPVDFVKLSVMYMITYNAGEGIVSQGSGSGTGGMAVNLADGSFLSHVLSVGAELRI